jgi:copper(I)-binding protein
MTLLDTPRFTVLLLACLGGAAGAHVTLPPGGATAGTVYPAAFRVGHACDGAAATTALEVRLPEGFVPVDAPSRPGWTVRIAPGLVRWTADSAATALPASQKTRFVVRGRLPAQPGTLWFKALQVCDSGRADWATVPAGPDDKPAFPAARLDVLAPGVAPVAVSDAWIRPSVPGQRSTGAYARFTAGAGARLVGGEAIGVGSVEVHEMRLDGNVMRMRELAEGLELPPGDPVQLEPGGRHLMLSGLDRPLLAGTRVPLRLRFVDAEGRRSELQVEVPVGVPRDAPAPPAGGHAGH